MALADSTRQRGLRIPRRALYQTVTVALGALPGAWLLTGLVRVLLGDFDALGPEPIDTLTRETGQWALRLLLASLAITPLRVWLGWRVLAPLRRTVGLLAFAYALMHLLTYAIGDQGLLLPGPDSDTAPSALSAIGEDIAERPYITVGFSAFLVLLLLAATSTRASIRRLGRRWQTLHRLVYAAALLAVLHFLWLVKLDVREPAIYAAVLGALLLLRIPLLRRLALAR